MNTNVIVKFALLLFICLSMSCQKKDQIDPTVYIINPQDNSTVSGAIRIKAAAMDNKEVSYVEFYINNIRKGVDSIASNSIYEYVWNTSAESSGIKVISAKAYDKAGNVGESPSISVTIESHGPTYHSGIISVNETWTKSQSPHIINGELIISANLNLEAGAVIELSANDTIWSNITVANQGDIQVRGTDGEPIIFTSDAQIPQPADWNGIFFESSESENSIFDNCIIEYSDFGINIYERTISIINSRIQYNDDYGILCEGSRFIEFHDNIITENDGMPISINADGVTTIGTNNILIDNNNGNYGDCIEVNGGEIIHSGIWRNQGVPYIITDDIYLTTDNIPPVITIEAGSILAFDGTSINLDDATDLNATNVTFTSPYALTGEGNPGDWNGFYCEDGFMNLNNCTIEFGSGDNAVLEYITSTDYRALSINNTTIRNCSESGVYVDASENSDISITNTRIKGCGNYPAIITQPDYIRAIGTGNNFTGNINDNVYISEGGEVLVSGTWNNCNVPYLLQSTIEIGEENNPTNITIMPGVNIKFYDGFLDMETGALIADGSAGQIVFTNATQGSNWGGIILEQGIDQNLTRLNHCIIQYAGSDPTNGSANIYCQFSSPRITNCDINNSMGWGIALQGSSLIPDSLSRYNHIFDNDSGDIRVLPESIISNLKQTVRKQISNSVIQHRARQHKHNQTAKERNYISDTKSSYQSNLNQRKNIK